MSSPAPRRAESYDTADTPQAAQQRKDSTICMVAKVSYDLNCSKVTVGRNGRAIRYETFLSLIQAINIHRKAHGVNCRTFYGKVR